ncbi:MAG: alpha-L-rhamnosidase C-terminal domain-containing protein, partial [Acidimicrobiia bacterium]
WIYRHLAGIAPDRSRPGYRHVVFAPMPPAGIEWAHASVDAPLGPTSIAWQIETGGDLSVDIVLPFGAAGSFIAPATGGSEIVCDGIPSDKEATLGPGSHRLSVTNPRISGAG